MNASSVAAFANPRVRPAPADLRLATNGTTHDKPIDKPIDKPVDKSNSHDRTGSDRIGPDRKTGSAKPPSRAAERSDSRRNGDKPDTAATDHDNVTHENADLAAVSGSDNQDDVRTAGTTDDSTVTGDNPDVATDPETTDPSNQTADAAVETAANRQNALPSVAAAAHPVTPAPAVDSASASVLDAVTAALSAEPTEHPGPIISMAARSFAEAKAGEDDLSSAAGTDVDDKTATGSKPDHPTKVDGDLKSGLDVFRVASTDADAGADISAEISADVEADAGVDTDATASADAGDAKPDTIVKAGDRLPDHRKPEGVQSTADANRDAGTPPKVSTGTPPPAGNNIAAKPNEPAKSDIALVSRAEDSSTPTPDLHRIPGANSEVESTPQSNLQSNLQSMAHGVRPIVMPPHAIQIAPTFSAAAQMPSVPVEGLAVEIAARAHDGKNRFEIRLDPPELGRIEVRLEVDRTGQVMSRLIADRSDTLDLLRRDAAGLERALHDAGLKTADNGLQFSLRDQTAGQHGRFEHTGETARLIANDDALPVIAEIPQTHRALAALRGGIDIRV
jgi:flagellar hook-length control protein FliK